MPSMQSVIIKVVIPPSVMNTVTVNRTAMRTTEVCQVTPSHWKVCGNPKMNTMQRAPTAGIIPKFSNPAKNANPPANNRKRWL